MNNLHLHQSWCLYLNGIYHHDKIVFLPNGHISHNNTEGFFRWEKIADNKINLYDKLDLLSYTLEYNASAHLWINIAKYRIKNNDVFLAPNYSNEQIIEKFQNNSLFCYVANKIYAYRSSVGELWSYLFLGLDGKIYHHSHENEHAWYIQDDKLYITNQQGEITSISENLSTSNRIIELNFIPAKSKHYLEYFYDNQQNSPKFLHLDVCFSNHSDILLVTINSSANEYNGYSNKFEFHKLPHRYGVDYIRVSQSAPTRWYINDFDKIQSIIELNQYKKIVIQGISIGGFASLWLTESLARRNPHINYHSISIQPLTSLKPIFLQYLRDNFSDGWRSRTPTDDILENLPNDIELDIAKMLEADIPNITHHILYDKLNSAEKYSSERLKSNRVHLIGFDLNINHSEGSGKIANSSILAELQKTLLQFM